MRVPIFAAAFALLLAAAANAQSVTRRIAVPDGGWDYVSFDVHSNRLFISRSDGVLTIDVGSGTVSSQFVAVARTHAALALPGTALGAVTSTAAGGVVLFDATTGAVKATVKTGPTPDAAIYSPVLRTLLVMDHSAGTVTMIDPVTATVTGTVAVGGALESAAVDRQGHLFVAVADRNEIAAIYLKSKTVMRRTKLAGCDEPGGLVLTKEGILIASCANRAAKVIDAATGAPLADLVIGPGPDAVLYDAIRNRAYVPTAGDGKLTVIDTSARVPRVLTTVTTQTGARTGAVDPQTGTVYVIAAKYEPAAGNARPKAIPSSVEVLAIE